MGWGASGTLGTMTLNFWCGDHSVIGPLNSVHIILITVTVTKLGGNKPINSAFGDQYDTLTSQRAGCGDELAEKK